MDNHRAAMWCWLQELAPSEPVGLLHIDEHFDTLYANIDSELSALPELTGMSVTEYLQLSKSYGSHNCPLIRWDNYLSLFLERYGKQVEKSVFVTHNVGDKPRHQSAQFPDPQHVPDNLSFWLKPHPDQWIINIDLDYFFCDQNGQRRPMFSDQYIASVFGAIADLQQAGRVKCLTICLSPDEGYSGSWEQAEQLCQVVCNAVGLRFALPP